MNFFVLFRLIANFTKKSSLLVVFWRCATGIAIYSLSLRSSRLCLSHLICRMIFAIEFFTVHTSGYSILIEPDLYNMTTLLSYKVKSNESHLRSYSMLSQKFDRMVFISCLLNTVGVNKNWTLVFVNFSAQDASILKISVTIFKRRSWGFQNTPRLQSLDDFEPSYGTLKKNKSFSKSWSYSINFKIQVNL